MLRPPRIDGPPGPVGFRRRLAGLASTTPAPIVPGIPVVVPAAGAPDLITQALSRIITQYRNKPKLAATLLAVAYVFQDIVNAAVVVPTLDDFDQAGGVNLDVTASYVGQSRVLAGYVTISDDFLRILARLRIIRNHSIGAGPEIIAATAALFNNDGTLVTYTSPGGMYVDLQVARQPTALEAAAVNSDLLPRPAGVDLSPSWYVPTNFVGWDDDPDPGAVGMSEEGDDSIGGYLAEFI